MSITIFTNLPNAETAQLTDILCAVQNYVSVTELGTSVQESLQQIYDLFLDNLIQSYDGNPNGILAGQQYGLLWDTLHSIAWVCTTTGTADTAVWKPIVGELTNGQVLIGSTGNAPVAATLTAGANVTITNAAGSITIASSGGSGGGGVNEGTAGQLGCYAITGSTISGLTANNNATFYTDTSGVAACTDSMADGEILIGSSSGSPIPATLTAGTGIAITNAANSITITSTAGTSVAPTQQLFATVGSGTYTRPAGVSYIKVQMVGGGGGASGSGVTGSNGSDGTASSFGTLLTALGGGAGLFYNSPGNGGYGGITSPAYGFTVAGGDGCGIALSGSASTVPGLPGGVSYFGGAGGATYASGIYVIGTAAAVNSGSGGGTSGTTAATGTKGGGSGGAGGYVEAYINTPDATYSYIVGAGGNGGAGDTTGGGDGGDGGSGVIIVTEYY